MLALALLAGQAVTAPPAGAQRVEEVRVQADNDNFSFWLPIEERGDHEYTHGAWIRVTTRSAPLWGRRFAAGTPVCDGEAAEARCLLTAWEIGQRIYTPRENTVEPVPGDRPHAGWLYGAASAIARGDVDRHLVRLEVGVTGPPSLAATAQHLAHRIGGFWEPVGWHNQLPFEPGILARYEYARLLAAPTLDDATVAELAASGGASVGNVITGADLALDLRVGHNVPPSWRVDRRGAGRVSVYAFAGIRGTGYLRNLFLDGSTARPSLRVDKFPFVQHHHVGAAVRINDTEVSYSVATRTREYRTEPSGHRYSTIALTIRR